MIASTTVLDRAIAAAFNAETITSSQARLARAIDSVMPNTDSVILIAAAIHLDEEHDILASAVRRNFGAGGIMFDLVTGIVAKFEAMELCIKNAAAR